MNFNFVEGWVEGKEGGRGEGKYTAVPLYGERIIKIIT